MSKALEHFWRWALGEKPTAELFEEKLQGNLAEHEQTSIWDAAAHIAARALGDDFDYSVDDYRYCLEHQPEAFRALSLELCAAVERMRETVPAAEPWKRLHAPRSWAGDAVDAAVYALTGISELHASGRRDGMSSGVTKWWSPGQTIMGIDVDRLTELHHQMNERIAKSDRMERLYQGEFPADARPKPIATDFADGTHMHDVMCQCGRYILKPGKVWFAADVGHGSFHSQGGCR